MKYIRDEVFLRQIPETEADFAEIEADQETVTKLMRKWGYDSVKIDGMRTWFARPNSVMKE